MLPPFLITSSMKITSILRSSKRVRLKGHNRPIIAQQIRIFKVIQRSLWISNLWRSKFYSGKNY